MNFTELVQMFYNHGLIAYGQVKDPVTEEYTVNIHSGDTALTILTLLATKTKGNLEEDEKQVLKKALEDLEKLRKHNPSTPGPSF
jgi:hypothetical protein